jgi:hypothetical protein
VKAKVLSDSNRSAALENLSSELNGLARFAAFVQLRMRLEFFR